VQSFEALRGNLNMRKFGRVVFALALMVPVFGAGCAEHQRVYVWGPGESTYYVQWEHETHRDHVEWEARSEGDRNAYWKWRHHHHD
jgi:hypothetical protein